MNFQNSVQFASLIASLKCVENKVVLRYKNKLQFLYEYAARQKYISFNSAIYYDFFNQNNFYNANLIGKFFIVLRKSESNNEYDNKYIKNIKNFKNNYDDNGDVHDKKLKKTKKSFFNDAVVISLRLSFIFISFIYYYVYLIFFLSIIIVLIYLLFVLFLLAVILFK
jgi:uncharacterized membrane protein